MLLRDGQTTKNLHELPQNEAFDQFTNLKETLGESLKLYQDNLKRREFEELSKGVGTWKVHALNQLVQKVLLPAKTRFIIKLLQATCVAYVFLLSFMHMFKPTACVNKATIGFKMEERHVSFLYSLPPFLHLLTMLWIFTSFAYYKLIVSVIVGVVSGLWHLIIFILYFAYPADPAILDYYPVWHAIIYWLLFMPVIASIILTGILLVQTLDSAPPKLQRLRDYAYYYHEAQSEKDAASEDNAALDPPSEGQIVETKKMKKASAAIHPEQKIVVHEPKMNKEQEDENYARSVAPSDQVEIQ